MMFKPHARATVQVGYSITSADGQTPQFNVLQPPGSLQYNYYQPLANIAVDIGHNLTAKAAWNYYQYGEGVLCGTYRSPLFSRQQCDVFASLGLLSGPVGTDPFLLSRCFFACSTRSNTK